MGGSRDHIPPLKLLRGRNADWNVLTRNLLDITPLCFFMLLTWQLELRSKKTVLCVGILCWHFSSSHLFHPIQWTKRMETDLETIKNEILKKNLCIQNILKVTRKTFFSINNLIDSTCIFFYRVFKNQEWQRQIFFC